MGRDALRNRLTFIRPTSKRNTSRQKISVYRCSCGNEIEAIDCKVRFGHTRSCGCLHKEIMTTHGHYVGGKTSALASRWECMMSRCTRPRHKSYPAYGGRGITVHDRWYNFENWLADMGSSFFEGACQDRINPDGNYEPGNVQWLSRSDNSKKMYTDRFKYEDLTHEQIEEELHG